MTRQLISRVMVCSLALVALGLCASVRAEEEYSPEKIKAAFLYNFGSFVVWPESAPPPLERTIVVVDAPAIAAELRRIAQGRTIQGRSVRVSEGDSAADIEGAQILFIGAENGARVRQLARAVRDKPVLVVTQLSDALNHGAMINFAIVDRRVRFEVALSSVHKSGLDLSSRLLAIALRVERSGALFHRREDDAILRAHAAVGSFSTAVTPRAART